MNPVCNLQRSRAYKPAQHTIQTMKKLLAFGCLSLITLSTTAQWRWQHPAPQGNQLSKMFFISSTTGWVTGEKGAILKTVNAGQSWTTQYAGILDNIGEVYFTDSLNGFVCSEEALYGTTNGGQSWSIKYRYPGFYVTALTMANADTGYIALGDGSGDTRIMQTLDGGANWNVLTTINGSEIKDIAIKNSGLGIMCGSNGTAYRTTDSGFSWAVIVTGTSGDLEDVSLPTNNQVYIGGFNVLLKSTNGGISFSDIGNPGSPLAAGLLSVDFSNGNNGVAGCELGNIFTTTDGGNSWNNYSTAPWFNARTVTAGSGFDFYAAGSEGGLYKTTNSGATWSDLTQRSTESNLSAVDVINPTSAYAAGFGGTIVYTNNGGNTWVSQNSNAGGEDLKDILFINTTTGIAVGTNGTIVKTTNGGNTWNFVFSGIGENLYGIARASANKLYVCGANGFLAVSTNNGDTWTPVSTDFTGIGYAYTSLECFGNDSLVICTDQPYIVSTYDNGLSWNLLNVPSSFECKSMYFRNALNGWVGTSIGELYSTSDGGNNWNLDYQTLSNGPMNVIRFSDQQNGWFSSGNEIFRTNNGGGVWGREINPNNNAINDIDFYTGNNAVAVGDGFGTILARSNDMTLSLPTNIFCTDNNYSLVINANGTWNAGNQFIIELSDEFGEFVFPTSIGNVAATGTTVVPVFVPNGLIDGTDYRIRVFSTNPPMWSPLNSQPLEVRTSPEAYITAGGPTAFCQGGSVTLYALTSAGWNYQWYKDGILISGATADTLVATQTGDYTVMVGDGVCSLTSPITDVLVLNCSGLSENNAFKYFVAAPNPFSGEILLRNKENKRIDRVSIADQTGRLIMDLPTNSTSDQRIPTEKIASGIYQLIIQGERNAVIRITKL